MAIKPEKLLNQNLDKKVRIVMRNGNEYLGTLKGFDEFMNLTLEEAVLTPRDEDAKSEDVGSLVIKGYDTSLIIPQT